MNKNSARYREYQQEQGRLKELTLLKRWVNARCKQTDDVWVNDVWVNADDLSRYIQSRRKKIRGK